MPGQAFRFLQAGGFALDQPLGGLAEVPEPLREVAIDAPFTAAERVCEAAVEEKVDFLALTGELVDLTRVSPRAVSFLLESFERLHDRGIAVYWAAGRLDAPQDWPEAASLPDNVLVFSSARPQELAHFRGARPVANLVGRSWHGTAGFQLGEFSSDADGLPTIVIANGQADEAQLAAQAADYWALGGRAQRQTLGTAERIIHYSGSPQGRNPQDDGPHGCTLVHVGADRGIRTQFIPTDAIRWHTERLTVEGNAPLDAVRAMLADRVKQLKAEAEPRPLIVTWKLSGGEHLAGPAGRRDLAAEWQAWLRKEFFLAGSRPAVWTHSVELEPAELPSAWYDEESMLGDFLRNLRELADRGPDSVDLEESIPQVHRVEPLAALARWTPGDYRELLWEAALTGAQLLGAADRE